MLLIPAILESDRSQKDRTRKLIFETNELTSDQAVAINNSLQKAGFLAFKLDEIKSQELEMIGSLKSDYDDVGKTPSQRLRAVLFLNWKQKDEGFKTAEQHYDYHIEKIINHYKKKLE